MSNIPGKKHMPKKNDFVEYIIQDVLRKVPNVTSKYMFGGYCLFAQGKIFAIVDEDVLYFKADETNQKDYEKAGSRQFEYPSKKGPMKMAYWQVPDDVMEDPAIVAMWAQKSISIKKKTISKNK
jgi:DNA transformation protein